MNNIIKRLLKYFSKFLFILLSIIILLYFGLWIFITMSVPIELKQLYEQTNIVDLTERQYRLIWSTWTENNNFRFKWYPIILDGYFQDGIDSYASLLLLYKNEKTLALLNSSPSRLPVSHIEYGLSRYIKWDNNYKKAFSVISTYGYMNNNIYGFENASKYYYSKNAKDLSEIELISLVILYFSPSRYEIGSHASESKTDEIMKRIFN